MKGIPVDRKESINLVFSLGKIRAECLQEHTICFNRYVGHSRAGLCRCPIVVCNLLAKVGVGGICWN